MKRIVIQITLLYISLTILFPGFLVGQTPEENAWKYWYYRWRLINDFLLIGDCHGCSIPASIRLEYYKFHVPGHFKNIKWGDASVDLGWYISVLAGEYRILHDNGEPTDSVAKELYYALLALERLDAYSDEIEQGNPNLSAPQSTPYPSNMLDGYFVRDDVPEDFLNNNYAHFNSGWASVLQLDSMTSSYVERVNSASQKPCGTKDALTGIGESVDQFSGVFLGLASIKFFLPSSASFNGQNFHNWADELTDRIMGHIRDNDGTPYSNCQGDYIYPADKPWAKATYWAREEAACRIKQASGQPISHPFIKPVAGIGFGFSFQYIHFPPYSSLYQLPWPTNFVFGISTTCSDFKLPFWSWASREILNSTLTSYVPRKVCNTHIQGNGLVASIPTILIKNFFTSNPDDTLIYIKGGGLCKLCNWNANILSYPALIGQPYYGIVFHWYPFSFLWIKLPMWLGFAQNKTSAVLDGLAWGADHHFEVLASHVFYKTPNKPFVSWDFWKYHQELINIAPCNGPYNFKAAGGYFYPNNDWMVSNRFLHPESRFTTSLGIAIPKQCHRIGEGEFNGLDYMNLYNFYYFHRKNKKNFITNFAHYENVIDRELVSTKHDLPLINKWGSYVYPAWIAAFHTIEASNVLSKKAQVEYVAGEYIHLKPGFHAQQGCYFHAYLDTLRGCDYSKKPANYQGPFFPFANQTSYGKFAPPASEADVPEKITVPEERFEAMHSQSGYLHVFPNPANKILHVKSYGPEGTELIIRDVFGRILFQEKGFFEEKTIDISTWNKGVYIVEMKHLEGTERTKFIKIK